MEVSWIDPREVSALAEGLRVPRRPESRTGSRPVPRSIPAFDSSAAGGMDGDAPPADLAVGRRAEDGTLVKEEPGGEAVPLPPAEPSSLPNLATFRERLKAIRDRAIQAGLLVPPEEPAPDAEGQQAAQEPIELAVVEGKLAQVQDWEPPAIPETFPAALPPGPAPAAMAAFNPPPAPELPPPGVPAWMMAPAPAAAATEPAVVQTVPWVDSAAEPFEPAVELPPVNMGADSSWQAAPVPEFSIPPSAGPAPQEPWVPMPMEPMPMPQEALPPPLPVAEPPQASPPSSVGERLDFYADWTKSLLGERELLMVDEYGGLLWGPQAKSGLVLSTMMAWNAAIRASALSACNPPDLIVETLATGGNLTVIPTQTRLGMIQVAVVRAWPLSDQDVGLMRQTLQAVMDA